MSSRLMEAKLKKANKKAKKRSSGSFIGDLKEELKKISWTSKKELLQLTKVVLLAMLLFGFGIYLVDFIIKGALEGIKLALRFIFG